PEPRLVQDRARQPEAPRLDRRRPRRGWGVAMAGADAEQLHVVARRQLTRHRERRRRRATGHPVPALLERVGDAHGAPSWQLAAPRRRTVAAVPRELGRLSAPKGTEAPKFAIDGRRRRRRTGPDGSP